MTPVLSLVTGKVGRDASFQRLVDSIVAHTDVDWELIVADASEAPYVPTTAQIRVLHEVPRLGCSKAYNRAFREATGEWVLWLNDDAEVLPGYATTAIRFMEAHPRIGLGALHYTEGETPFHVNSAWGVPYANFGILRRSLGNEIGWFDESLEMYGCDNSITLKVLLAGHGVSDIPGARVIHHSEQDANRAENQNSRRRDNRTLQETYMSSRRRWTGTYLANRVDTGTVPWSHGVDPRMAGVR